MPPTVTVFGVEGLPEIQPDADLATLIADACARQRTPLAAGDVFLCEPTIRHGIYNTSDAEATLLAIHPVLNPPPRIEVD